jgi:hypothetical protein
MANTKKNTTKGKKSTKSKATKTTVETTDEESLSTINEVIQEAAAEFEADTNAFGCETSDITEDLEEIVEGGNVVTEESDDFESPEDFTELKEILSEKDDANNSENVQSSEQDNMPTEEDVKELFTPEIEQMKEEKKETAPKEKKRQSYSDMFGYKWMGLCYDE